MRDQHELKFHLLAVVLRTTRIGRQRLLPFRWRRCLWNHYTWHQRVLRERTQEEPTPVVWPSPLLKD